LTKRTTFQKSVAVLKPIPSKIEPRFLYYLLQAELERLVAFAGGTAQKNLLLRDLRAFAVEVPSRAIQKGVVSILSAYGDLIENNTRRIRILEEMAQMIYREWFVNFRFPGHEKFKMVESEIGPIPEGWAVHKFSDFIESSFGGDWGSDTAVEGECCPVFVIRGTDFDDLYWGKPLRVPSRFISFSSFERRRLKPNDILVENSVNAKTRCAGSSFLVTSGALRRSEGNWIAASFCRVFRPKRSEFAPVLYAHLRHIYGNGRMAFYQNVAANGIANFQTTRFLQTEFVVIPNSQDLLRRMLTTLAVFSSSNLADRIHVLRKTRDFLLPKLISGEVSVENLEVAATA
jgi:type I restriction enzyme S subunit